MALITAFNTINRPDIITRVSCAAGKSLSGKPFRLALPVNFSSRSVVSTLFKQIQPHTTGRYQEITYAPSIQTRTPVAHGRSASQPRQTERKAPNRTKRAVGRTGGREGRVVGGQWEKRGAPLSSEGRNPVPIPGRSKHTTTGNGATGGGDVREDGQLSVRINKCFREIASRREADDLVAAGRVFINHEVASPGARVGAGDLVELDGRRVEWEHLNILPTSPSSFSSSSQGGARSGYISGEERFVYIKFWKPRGITCTTDRSIRGNIVDAIGHTERIFMVGRLDKDSSGIILLTSDGRVPNSVLRSISGHTKVYQVRTAWDLSERDLSDLRAGVVITTVAQRDRVSKELTVPTLPCSVKRIGNSKRTVEITLTEGRNRQIRKMMEAIGNEVITLHRVRFMDITLKGLRIGEWSDLSHEEMEGLRQAVQS